MTPISSVVAVSGEPERTELLDRLMADANDYDIIFVESMARAYSRIKQLMPDLVVVFVGLNDGAACQLLSMLALDPDVCGIPVVTSIAERPQGELEDILAELTQDSSNDVIAIRMN